MFWEVFSNGLAGLLTIMTEILRDFLCLNGEIPLAISEIKDVKRIRTRLPHISSLCVFI